MIGDVPVYGSRQKSLIRRVASRMMTLILLGAAVGGAFLLSHLSREPSAHQADDQEQLCRAIEESGEEDYVGQLAECRTKLARLRVIEHANR